MSTFTVNVQNSTGTTIYGLCLFHYCNGHLDTYYVPALAPGTGPTLTFTTFSGRTDYYYITFGYKASAIGISSARTVMARSTCDAPDDATSMFFHVTPINYWVQYNNHQCGERDYDSLQLLDRSTPTGPVTFNMAWTNSNSYAIQAFVLHMSIFGTPTSTWFNLGPYTTSNDVLCYDDRSDAGDLYTVCFINHVNTLFIGQTQNQWNHTDSYILLRAPFPVDGDFMGFSTQYSSAPFPTLVQFFASTA